MEKLEIDFGRAIRREARTCERNKRSIKLTFTNATHKRDPKINRQCFALCPAHPVRDAIIEKMHINGVAEMACRQHIFMNQKKNIKYSSIYHTKYTQRERQRRKKKQHKGCNNLVLLAKVAYNEIYGFIVSGQSRELGKKKK